VYRLLALASPPASARLTAAEARGFPAVQLFVERADFQLSDADAPNVAEICRKADGLPVAIEFAAAHVAPFRSAASRHTWTSALRRLMSGRPTRSYRAFRDGPSDSCPLYAMHVFWMQGLFGQSAEAVRNALADAQAGGNPVSVGQLDR
jgi:hypothetical protein